MGTNIPYRGFRIVSADMKGRKLARVLVGDARAASADFEGATIDEAVQHAKAWVDEARAAETHGRRAPHIGTAEEYARFLRTQPVAAHHHALLTAHARAPDQVMTATELAEAARWDSHSSTNVHYGQLGRQVAEFLELRPVTFAEPIWTSVLADTADGRWGAEGREFRWRMHRELVEALAITTRTSESNA